MKVSLKFNWCYLGGRITFLHYPSLCHYYELISLKRNIESHINFLCPFYRKLLRKYGVLNLMAQEVR